MSSADALGTVPTSPPLKALRTSITRSRPTCTPPMSIFSRRTWSLRTSFRSASEFMWLLEMIERQIECVEVTPASVRKVAGRAVCDQRHLLLGKTAMRSQRDFETGKIVAIAVGPDDRQAHG